MLLCWALRAASLYGVAFLLLQLSPANVLADDTIRIASILSLSGPNAAIGEGARRGQLLAIEEINASGGINGRHLEVLFEDSAGEPSRAISALNSLQPKLTHPVVYSSLTGVAQALKPQTEKRELLLFIESTLPGILKDTKFALRNFIDFGVAYGELRLKLEERGVKRVTIIRGEEEWSEAAIGAFKARGTPKLVVVAEEVVSKGSTDTRAQLLRLKAKGVAVDALIIVLTGSSQSATIVQSVQLGITTPKITSYLCSQPGILDTIGNTYEGQESLEGARDVSSPEYQSFLARYKAAYNLTNPEFNSLTAYDSLMIIAQALRAGMKTAQEIREYIVNKSRFPGVLGLTTFNDTGDAIRGGQLDRVVGGRCVPGT